MSAWTTLMHMSLRDITVYHYTNLCNASRLIEASFLDLSALVGDASTAQLMARGLTLYYTNAISSVNRNDAAFTLTTIQPLLNGLLRSLRALMSYKADHLRADPKWLLYFINVKKLFSLNIFSMGQITHRKPQKSFLLSCRTCQRFSGIVICISASPYNQRGIVRSLLTKPENFGNQNFIAC
jgi:hypothetical protein